MREILFRGKTLAGKWIEGAYYKQELFYGDKEDAHVIITSNEILTYDQALEFSVCVPETIGQYTGLIDKNGKKIFEGDIIKSCEYDDIYFVKYCADDNYPAFDVVPEMNIECNGLSHLHIVEGIEVIGNIHDNPELLEGENDKL